VFTEYLQKLKEMHEATELAVFNAELASSFAQDAVDYSTQCTELLDQTLELLK